MNLINTPTLNTDRLILRKFDESDMEALLKIALYGGGGNFFRRKIQARI